MVATLFRNASTVLLQVKCLISTRFCHGLASHSPLQFQPFSNLDFLVSRLITAVTSTVSVFHCRALHCRVMKSVSYSHGFIGDQLVSAYLRLGSIGDAHNLFDELSDKDSASWNSLISGFSRRGDLGSCVSAFLVMKLDTDVKPNDGTVIPLISACTGTGTMDIGAYIHGCALKFGMLLDLKVANALINMYGKSGYLDAATRLFEAIPVPNLVSWNSIIAVHVQIGAANEAIIYFIHLRRAGIEPDQATLLTMVQACESLGSRKLAEAIHGFVFHTGLNSNVTIATGLLSLYSKLGSLTDSQQVFREIRNPDAIAWTAMLASYGIHGSGNEAVKHFELMISEGVAPDHVTFTHLLSSCSHAGLLQEGKSYLELMSSCYGVEPRIDHYSCMVDLLGRAGLVYDAYKLIRTMPMKPNSGVWGALMGACRKHGNIDIGKEVFENLYALDPSDSRNYISLSNMYAAAGLRYEASKARSLMKGRSVVQNPGSSSIEHGNKINIFVSGDQSHPLREEIYKKLDELVLKIRGSGISARTELVLQDIDEEEVKEEMINKHSEKLAIAFGLLVNGPNEMPLVITKNLRICGDCHDFAKVVSRIEGRKIIRESKTGQQHYTPCTLKEERKSTIMDSPISSDNTYA
ncbi:Pentatricopeptide repeat-containing protein At5g40410, mitochondrial [Linum perenne]